MGVWRDTWGMEGCLGVWRDACGHQRAMLLTRCQRRWWKANPCSGVVPTWPKQRWGHPGLCHTTLAAPHRLKRSLQRSKPLPGVLRNLPPAMDL